ncbi:prepilin-type N-terminal cleavage/methylation domain-containing protein [Dactylosporangium sp. NPDC051484]|uniref:prepilin-type N-terminal cleavage/methylation domain-containing protein n=1 Tax=Dactylosporangium sp. NPDC051484 TaxID=3154942 RepID=UPI00344B49ED
MRVRRDERGLTLVEVLVAIAILGIIIIPLGNALLSFIRNTDDTTRRLSESHDAQIMAAYFAQDVQSVGVRDWEKDGFPLKQSIFPNVDYNSLAYNSPADKCGADDTPKAVVGFAWNNRGTSETVRVSYVVKTVGTERQLHRIRCVGSLAPVNIVLARNVVDATPPDCSAVCSAAPKVPQSVTLTVTIKASGGQQPLIVTLTGQRRQT